MVYYNSDDVQVFPTVRRNDSINRKDRLNTEENIVGLSNIISSGQSYILNGFNFDGSVLSSGVCVIKGYYFKIENNIQVEDIADDDKFLYLKIKIKENTYKPDPTNDANKINFKELSPINSNTNILDDSAKFLGLEIETTKTEQEDSIEEDSIEKVYLLVAKKDDNKK